MSVEVGRFHDLHEAELAAGLLRSAGIRAEVADHHLIGIDPLMQRAVGGLRVMAPPDQAADARAILARVQAGEFADADADPLPEPEDRPGHGAAMALGVLAFPWAVAGMTGARRSLSRRRRLAPLALGLLMLLLIVVPWVVARLG